MAIGAGQDHRRDHKHQGTGDEERRAPCSQVPQSPPRCPHRRRQREKYDAGAAMPRIKIDQTVPFHGGPASAYAGIGKTQAAYLRDDQ